MVEIMATKREQMDSLRKKNKATYDSLMNSIKTKNKAFLDSLREVGMANNMANAHENIDNEIMINTLDRIAQSSSGNWMEGLYKGTTRGGEERYVHRTQPRYPNEDAWRDMTMNLNQQIRENPSFADTLSQSELPRVRKGMVDMSRPGIIERLISKLF